MGEPQGCDENGNNCDELTVYDYDFKPVNIGFAIACGVAFYQLGYNIYLGLFASLWLALKHWTLGKQLLRQAAAAEAGGVAQENEKTSDAQMKGLLF